MQCDSARNILVAPPAGAWIETLLRSPTAPIPTLVSLPPRERGLKLYPDGQYALIAESLPPRERGLKLGKCGANKDNAVSLPPRERGLKPLCLST